MAKLKRCVLIVGVILLLPGVTRSAQGLWNGWQVHTSVTGISDLTLEGDGAPSKGCTWATAERNVVCNSASEQVGFATADGLADDNVQAIAVDGEGRWWFGAHSIGGCVLDDWRTLFNVAEGSDDELNPTPENNVSRQGTGVDEKADLVVAKADDPDPVIAGETLTYTLTVTNNGPSDATGVTVSDPLPSGVTFVSATPSQGTYDSVTSMWTVGDLAEGNSATLILVLTVDPSKTEVLLNSATIFGNEPDPNTANNATTENTDVDAEADLAITKTDDPDPVIAGEPLTYTLIVTNNGPSDATGVTVVDDLPDDTPLFSATPSQGTYNSASGVWTVGSVADGGSATLTLVVTVDPSTRGTLSNSAQVSGDKTDPTPGDNTATAGTTVNAEADLTIAKTDDPDPVVAGEMLTYTLTATNNGPSDGTGVVVTDTLPPGVSFDAATPSQGTYDSGTGVWTVGAVADGDSVTLTLVVTVDPSKRGSLLNIAEVSATEPDPTPGNNADEEVTTVNAEADLVVAKTDDPDPVVAGEALTYTLAVTNSGPSDATGVTVVDDLPDDMILFSAVPSQGACFGVDPITCDMGALASGANATVSLVVTVASPLPNGTVLTNVVIVDGDQTDPYAGNNSAQAQTVVQSSPMLTITKGDAPDPVDAGGTLLYTLVITNSGNEDATSVIVTEHYDPNVSFFYSNPSPDSGSGNRVWTLPTVVVGSPETIDIVTTVASPLPVGTVLANQATLDNDQTMPLTVTEFTAVTSTSVLTLYTVGVPDPVQAGGTLVYVITYLNFGTAPAEGTVITETYDSRVTFISANPAPMGGTANVWDIGDLSVGEIGNITVTVGVPTPLSNGTILTNQVTMDSKYTSPQSVTETTRVSSAPDLTFTVTDHPDPVEAGTSLTYTLRYANTGNANATQVVVTAALDSRISLDGATPPPAGGSDPVWYWNVGTILGEVGYGEIVIRANVPFSILNGTILTFTAKLKDAEADSLRYPAQTTVHSLPDLTIGKVGEGHEPSLFSPGKRMDYIVTYGNAGYADCQDVIITTTLPTGTVYDEVGYGWQSSDDVVYTYVVGDLSARSTGHTITFTVVHTDTREIRAPEFNTPFTIAARGGTGEDVNPDDNAIFVCIGVPDLVVADLSVEQDPVLAQANAPVTFTFTITLMNQGTGMACNPDGMGSFFVDIFTAPVASYPYERNGVTFEVCDPIAAGLQSPPLVITQVITLSGHDLVFYIKADNRGYPYGLVPEFNEVNNLGVWPPHVYLPLVLRWDAYYEENDHWPSAYGPLASGQTYLAYPDDTEDYYYFTLPTTATVNVSVTNFAPTSSNGNTVALYGQTDGKELDLISYYKLPNHSSMSLGPHSLGPGKYYVRVYTVKGHSTTQLYGLTVTY